MNAQSPVMAVLSCVTTLLVVITVSVWKATCWKRTTKHVLVGLVPKLEAFFLTLGSFAWLLWFPDKIYELIDTMAFEEGSIQYTN